MFGRVRVLPYASCGVCVTSDCCLCPVRYSPQLECFISCSTTWQNSLVIGWLEKHGNSNNDMKTWVRPEQSQNWSLSRRRCCGQLAELSMSVMHFACHLGNTPAAIFSNEFSGKLCPITHVWAGMIVQERVRLVARVICLQRDVQLILCNLLMA